MHCIEVHWAVIMMNVATSPEPTAPDDLRADYDFRSLRGLMRGKYAERLRIVRLAEDVAASFADEQAVNDALREYLRGRELTVGSKL